jgi:hypothetical protein
MTGQVFLPGWLAVDQHGIILRSAIVSFMDKRENVDAY